VPVIATYANNPSTILNSIGIIRSTLSDIVISFVISNCFQSDKLTQLSVRILQLGGSTIHGLYSETNSLHTCRGHPLHLECLEQGEIDTPVGVKRTISENLVYLGYLLQNM